MSPPQYSQEINWGKFQVNRQHEMECPVEANRQIHFEFKLSIQTNNTKQFRKIISSCENDKLASQIAHFECSVFNKIKMHAGLIVIKEL